MIKAILFDIGGIVYQGTRDDFYALLEKELNLQKNELSEKVVANFDTLLLGEISFLSFIQTQFPKLTSSQITSAAKKAWKETFVLQEEVVNIIRSLKKQKYLTVCLSNATDFDVLMDKELKIDQLFDLYINSCDAKSKKPGEKIFRTALNQAHVKAKECIFIDDREKYLTDPNKMGILTILYEYPNQLKEKLKENKITV